VLDVTTTTAATAGATRERRESAQKGGSREGTEKDRGGRKGGHGELFYAAGAPMVALSYVTNLDGSAAACTDMDNGALSPQDVWSDQPPARGTPSTASGRPLTHDRCSGRSACGAGCT